MEITNKKVLILGGAGLVGRAICLQILEEHPSDLVVTSLSEREVKESIIELKPVARKTKLHGYWGNVFVREEFKDLSRNDIIENAERRRTLISDTFDALTPELLKETTFYKMCDKFKPDIIIDCINSATAVAYQNVYDQAHKVTYAISDKSDKAFYEAEKLLASQYMPQLIRHVQIAFESMKLFKVTTYLKIGTSGTGGMGLNIPYTHSEDKPSRMLLSKSGIAGAHSLLLFLMARTPESPIVKELKPAAAIAWKNISYGEIKKRGVPIKLEVVSFDDKTCIEETLQKQSKKEACYLKENDEVATFKAPYIDTGENGLFSLGEFEALTDLGQMEFITPEEIAEASVWEIKGRNTGYDIVNALDTSIMGPTYRAGFMQNHAIKKIKELEKKYEKHSVAFEILGPPRLTKLLFESYLLNRCYGTAKKALEESPKEMGEKVFNFLQSENKLTSEIISLGLPILLSNGKNIVRGQKMIIPAPHVWKNKDAISTDNKSVDKFCYDGWIDLRESNMRIWQERFDTILSEVKAIPEVDTSSRFDKDIKYWNFINGDVEIQIGKLASWILIREDEGIRMKA